MVTAISAVSGGTDPTYIAVVAALAGNAELFVTGDRRVLEWSASGPMRIVSPRNAWIILFEPHLNR